MEKILRIDEIELSQLGSSKNKQYISNEPFPNIYFDDFFNGDFLNKVLDEFPDLESRNGKKYNDSNQVKFATKSEYEMGSETRRFIHFLNSHIFLEFLSSLTGINNLIPDPYLSGGGCHEIKRGGFLKIHADFNKHPKNQLDRRINVLVYLNKNWDKTYGGDFELWNNDMTQSVKKIEPVFNRMAIFSTTSKSYHGHPDPLTCPDNRSRKSIALYYYTNGRPEEEVEKYLESHSTIFKARVGVDDQKDTEAYISNKVQKEKKKEFKAKTLTFLKAVRPPIILSALKKVVLKK